MMGRFKEHKKVESRTLVRRCWQDRGKNHREESHAFEKMMEGMKKERIVLRKTLVGMIKELKERSF